MKTLENLPVKEENPSGLYGKYIISKTNGNPINEDAEYFILRLDEGCRDKKHLAACKKAALAYAESIKSHLPKLASDLVKRYNL